MSDSVYKWAQRELDKIKCGEDELDSRHLSALLVVVSTKLDNVLDIERARLSERMDALLNGHE